MYSSSFLFTLTALLCSHSLSLQAQDIISGTKAATVLELYTSEGCSSCPPADDFLSTFAAQDDPFSTVIPLAYHVDYWNYIGWDDRFARPQFTLRQRQQVIEGNTSQVYTPGFVVNNSEWTSWFRGDKRVPKNNGEAGQISANFTNGILTVDYSGHPEIEGPYLLNIAYLGMGLSTKVKAGENRNRTLNHDYVVLDTFGQISQSAKWTLKLNSPPEQGQEETAIALWVSTTESIDVLQATAAILEEDAI